MFVSAALYIHTHRGALRVVVAVPGATRRLSSLSSQNERIRMEINSHSVNGERFLNLTQRASKICADKIFPGGNDSLPGFSTARHPNYSLTFVNGSNQVKTEAAQKLSRCDPIDFDFKFRLIRSVYRAIYAFHHFACIFCATALVGDITKGRQRKWWYFKPGCNMIIFEIKNKFCLVLTH